jgi:2-amino-4-hydroxy-6-hydroxymethyldihydropteridine diphosphokinase
MTGAPLQVAVALGSNLDDRYALLQSANRALAGMVGVDVLAASQVEETSAVGPAQPPFLNQMLLVECTRSLASLLTELQAVELLHGRRRTLAKGPRTLDLDIVYAGGVVIRSEDLLVPHPGLVTRGFWQRELAELIGVAAAADAIAEAQAHAGLDTAGSDGSRGGRRWSGSWETVV